jgi:hypothetical protein
MDSGSQTQGQPMTVIADKKPPHFPVGIFVGERWGPDIFEGHSSMGLRLVQMN